MRKRTLDGLPIPDEKEVIKIPCEICGSYITKYDSCECGTTYRELLEEEANAGETQETDPRT